MTEQRLKGRGAIVTGGSSGIGRNIVELFRRHGAEVLFTGRDRARGEAVAVATGACFLAADAEAGDHADIVADEALRRLGRLDILVNNAGDGGPKDTVAGAPAQELDRTLSVHLRAPWLLMARAVPEMRRLGGGSIVNICSVAGHRVGAASVAYSVSKAALLHLTRCGAAELGKYAIRVNSISPGYIETPIHTVARGLKSENLEAMKASIARFFMARQALARTGQTEDVAEIALYLSSEESRFVTGTDIVVDGGIMWGQTRLA